MSAKTNSSIRCNSSQSRTGSISGQSADKQARKSPANGQVSEANKKGTVASQRCDSYRIAFYGTPAEKEAYR